MGAEQVREVRGRGEPGGAAWRCWDSPPAPRASPRAPCTSTATCSLSPTATPEGGVGRDPQDVFVGSPPLAFTFGLGGLAIFPLRFGATATLLENASPANMVEIIETYKATVCFTAPTAYRAMMAAMDKGANLSSLRMAVSAGETLPAPVYRNGCSKTGKPILDGIGSTELLHIFITNRLGDAAGGATGKAGRRLRGEDGRRRHERSAARHHRPSCGARSHRLPLPRRRRARQATCATAGTSPATASCSEEQRLFPFRGPHRRHDHLVRLQHRRA